MGKHAGDVRAEGERQLDLEQLLASLGNGAKPDQRSREAAIACFLSGSEGWKEAVKTLGGAFADGETGLSVRKED